MGALENTKTNEAENPSEEKQATEPKEEKKPLKKRLTRLGIGALLGASAGFAYYYFIGCSSGGCPITSNPFVSTGYGALFGGIIAWS